MALRGVCAVRPVVLCGAVCCPARTGFHLTQKIFYVSITIFSLYRSTTPSPVYLLLVVWGSVWADSILDDMFMVHLFLSIDPALSFPCCIVGIRCFEGLEGETRRRKGFFEGIVRHLMLAWHFVFFSWVPIYFFSHVWCFSVVVTIDTVFSMCSK